MLRKVFPTLLPFKSLFWIQTRIIHMILFFYCLLSESFSGCLHQSQRICLKQVKQQAKHFATIKTEALIKYEENLLEIKQKKHYIELQEIQILENDFYLLKYVEQRGSMRYELKLIQIEIDSRLNDPSRKLELDEFVTKRQSLLFRIDSIKNELDDLMNKKVSLSTQFKSLQKQLEILKIEGNNMRKLNGSHFRMFCVHVYLIIS